MLVAVPRQCRHAGAKRYDDDKCIGMQGRERCGWCATWPCYEGVVTPQDVHSHFGGGLSLLPFRRSAGRVQPIVVRLSLDLLDACVHRAPAWPSQHDVYISVGM